MKKSVKHIKTENVEKELSNIFFDLRYLPEYKDKNWIIFEYEDIIYIYQTNDFFLNEKELKRKKPKAIYYITNK